MRCPLVPSADAGNISTDTNSLLLLPLTQQKSIVSRANAKTQSHSISPASSKKKKKGRGESNYSVAPSHTNGKLASLSQHTSTWRCFMFDWPRPTEAKAHKICRATSNHVAARRRHPSRLIGQASLHQSQSRRSQRRLQKGAMWGAFSSLSRVTNERLEGRSNEWTVTKVHTVLRREISKAVSWTILKSIQSVHSQKCQQKKLRRKRDFSLS